MNSADVVELGLACGLARCLVVADRAYLIFIAVSRAGRFNDYVVAVAVTLCRDLDSLGELVGSYLCLALCVSEELAAD